MHAQQLNLLKTNRSEIEILEQTAKSPVNGEEMKVIVHEGIKIDVCMSSNYIWFDHGELEALFKKKNRNVQFEPNKTFNVFDALDSLHLAEFIGELLGSIFEGASSW